MSPSRWPWLTLAIAVSAIAGHALVPVSAALQHVGYTPGSLSLVRLFGCHLVHYSRTHLLWDVATFTALGAWRELRDRARLVLFLGCGALLVPPLACALSPWVGCYAGLSGLVLGMAALPLGAQIARPEAPSQRVLACALLTMLLAKQLYELRIGNTSLVTFEYEGFSTVPAAHLVSVLVGACAGGVPPRPAQLFRSKVAANAPHFFRATG